MCLHETSCIHSRSNQHHWRAYRLCWRVLLAFASQHRLVLEAEFVDDGYHGEPTVIALWKEAGGPPAQLEVTSSIPIGKGMSSSAALCLSIVLCVHGGSIDKQAACEEAQRLEHVVLGTPCGLLDQMTMMHALEGKCVLIDFSTKTTTNDVDTIRMDLQVG